MADSVYSCMHTDQDSAAEVLTIDRKAIVRMEERVQGDDDVGKLEVRKVCLRTIGPRESHNFNISRLSLQLLAILTTLPFICIVRQSLVDTQVALLIPFQITTIGGSRKLLGRRLIHPRWRTCAWADVHVALRTHNRAPCRKSQILLESGAALSRRSGFVLTSQRTDARLQRSCSA